MDVLRKMEHEAMRARFADLRERWRISGCEVAELLGNSDCREQETTMRVLLEIDRVMRSLLTVENICEWLRDPGPHGLTPLAFLTCGKSERDAMLAAARLRHRQIAGFDA